MASHAIVVAALMLTTSRYEAAPQAAASSPTATTAATKVATTIDAAQLDRLIASLNDERVDARRAAASALALQDAIGPAIPALYAALLDSDGPVRRSACEAIRKFRGATEEMRRIPCRK